MLNFHLKLYKAQRETLVKNLKKAEATGDTRTVKRILAILALGEDHDKQTVASLLKVNVESMKEWLMNFLLFGVRGLKSKTSTGRAPNLTKSQKRELAKTIDKGPAAAVFIGNCWRSPMIQHLIQERFGVFYAVAYIHQLLKNMGFS